jgi:hypothetical protein
MPVLATAKRHFEDDVQRSRDLLDHARLLPRDQLRDDILRASWMMAVGACDAFFCDAYADLVSRALRAKDLQRNIAVPDRLGNLRIPAIAVIRQASGGWRWRMAAKELIEDESVLSLEKIKELFNQFCREKAKLVSPGSVEPWILHRDAKHRLFGVEATAYRKMTDPQKAAARKSAIDKFSCRFDTIFQRRHDCIHNCDRPKVAVQEISDGSVQKAIEDVEFLVFRSYDTLTTELSAYLTGLGFSGQTRNQVCT